MRGGLRRGLTDPRRGRSVVPRTTPVRNEPVTPSLAKAAASLATDGWPIFPCTTRKIPLVKGWQAGTATTDLAQIRDWWAAWPTASIGTPTGDLIVIDIDGPDGMRTRSETETQGLEWPVTLTVMTGRASGGAHFWYRAPEGVEIRNCVGLHGGRGIGPGVDVRGKGGLAILPPSPHETGRPYRWTVTMDPAPLPQWMVERLKPPPPRRIDAPIRSGGAYSKAALAGECRDVLRAAEGTLNHTLNRSAFKVGMHIAAGGLDEEEAFEALVAAAVEAGHPERGARNTIRSGLSAGMRS